MAINKIFRIPENQLPILFVRFYIVGYLLFTLPWTRGLFINLIPLSLILVIATVFHYHKNWDVKSIIWFLFIIISSFLIEMTGISSGKIFGHYFYREGLGWQIHGTPLLIGVNWLFLVYASRSIVMRYITKPVGHIARILSGAALMVFYDLLMEYVAPVMHMWQFEASYPPINNFIAWFIISLFYHTGFEVLHIQTSNKVAAWLFIIQWSFFLFIATYHLIFTV